MSGLLLTSHFSNWEARVKGPDYQTKTEDKACFLEASYWGDLLCETTVHSTHWMYLSRGAEIYFPYITKEHFFDCVIFSQSSCWGMKHVIQINVILRAVWLYWMKSWDLLMTLHLRGLTVGCWLLDYWALTDLLNSLTKIAWTGSHNNSQVHGHCLDISTLMNGPHPNVIICSTFLVKKYSLPATVTAAWKGWTHRGRQMSPYLDKWTSEEQSEETTWRHWKFIRLLSTIVGRKLVPTLGASTTSKLLHAFNIPKISLDYHNLYVIKIEWNAFVGTISLMEVICQETRDRVASQFPCTMASSLILDMPGPGHVATGRCHGPTGFTDKRHPNGICLENSNTSWGFVARTTVFNCSWNW